MHRPQLLLTPARRDRSLWRWIASAAALGASALLGGCHIEHHNGKDVDFDTSGKFEVCGAFCSQLLDCGEIGAADFADCYATCATKFDSDEAKVRAGCGCAVKASCSALQSKTCSGAPFPASSGSGAGADAGSSASPDASAASPDTSSADAGASGSGGAASDTAAGGQSGAVSTCKINQDCKPNQDCISGYCLERCKASCECATGQSCLNGYCSIAIAQDKPCSVDCECPSGSKCTAGFCK